MFRPFLIRPSPVRKFFDEETVQFVHLNDYMFRPFLIRPSSCRKFFDEESVQTVKKCTFERLHVSAFLD